MASERNFEYTTEWSSGIALAALENPDLQKRMGRTKFQNVSERMGTLKQTIPIPHVGYVTLKQQTQSAHMEAEIEVPVALNQSIQPQTEPEPETQTEPQTETDRKPPQPQPGKPGRIQINIRGLGGGLGVL